MEGSKGRNRKGFESLWADRFTDVETRPSDHIWKNISVELANQQVGSYKRRAFYYKLAAVASLFLAFLLGALYYTNSVSQNSKAVTVNNLRSTKGDGDNVSITALGDDKNDELTYSESNSVDLKNTQNNSELYTLSEDQKRAENVLKHLPSNEGIDSSIRKDQPANRMISTAYNSGILNEPATVVVSPGSNEIIEQGDIPSISQQLAKHMELLWMSESLSFPERIYGVPIYGNAELIKDENNNKFLWAGLNLGSGSFDPNYGPPGGGFDDALLASENAFSPALDANTAGLPLREESNSGPSIAVGIDVGKSIGKRWVIQSGLTYGRYRVNSNTNLIFSSANQQAVPLSFQNREALFSEGGVTVTNENVEIDNNFQLLSIPVKAGFVLVDKKFNVIINGGFASDIYLGNRLNSSGGEFANYDIEPGADSPYRRVHLNGLTSVQLGYQIQNNYYLSLEPSYRHAISDFAKTGNSFSSRPSSLGLVVGFRYLFR